MPTHAHFCESACNRPQARRPSRLLIDPLQITGGPGEQAIRSRVVDHAELILNIVNDLEREIAIAMQLEQLRQLRIAHHGAVDDVSGDDQHCSGDSRLECFGQALERVSRRQIVLVPPYRNSRSTKLA